MIITKASAVKSHLDGATHDKPVTEYEVNRKHVRRNVCQ